MGFETISIPAAGLVAVTSFLLLIIKNWRISFALLAIQYVGVFILLGMEWPLVMATTELIAGWMAVAVLGMAVLSIPENSNNHPLFYEPRQALGRLFYLLAAIFGGLMASSVASQMTQWIPGTETQQAWGGLILIGFGLLRLGFTSYPLSMISGLLTMLSGFEVLYAPMETSAFAVGLLAAVMLGLALTGAYLYMAPVLEEES